MTPNAARPTSRAAQIQSATRQRSVLASRGYGRPRPRARQMVLRRRRRVHSHRRSTTALPEKTHSGSGPRNRLIHVRQGPHAHRYRWERDPNPHDPSRRDEPVLVYGNHTGRHAESEVVRIMASETVMRSTSRLYLADGSRPNAMVAINTTKRGARATSRM
jgi:hypothetical protein